TTTSRSGSSGSVVMPDATEVSLGMLASKGDHRAKWGRGPCLSSRQGNRRAIARAAAIDSPTRAATTRTAIFDRLVSERPPEFPAASYQFPRGRRGFIEKRPNQ